LTNALIRYNDYDAGSWVLPLDQILYTTHIYYIISMLLLRPGKVDYLFLISYYLNFDVVDSHYIIFQRSSPLAFHIDSCLFKVWSFYRNLTVYFPSLLGQKCITVIGKTHVLVDFSQIVPASSWNKMYIIVSGSSQCVRLGRWFPLNLRFCESNKLTEKILCKTWLMIDWVVLKCFVSSKHPDHFPNNFYDFLAHCS